MKNNKKENNKETTKIPNEKPQPTPKPPTGKPTQKTTSPQGTKQPKQDEMKRRGRNNKKLENQKSIKLFFKPTSKEPIVEIKNKDQQEKITTLAENTRKQDEKPEKLETRLENNQQNKPIKQTRDKSTLKTKKIESKPVDKPISPASKPPTLSVKVSGRDVTDLMSLKTFLNRKKSEREAKQVDMRRTPAEKLCDAAKQNLGESS